MTSHCRPGLLLVVLATTALLPHCGGNRTGNPGSGAAGGASGSAGSPNSGANGGGGGDGGLGGASGGAAGDGGSQGGASGSGAASGGSPVGGNSGESGSGGAGAAGGAGGEGGSAEPDDCASFRDGAVRNQSIPLTVTNQRSTPVWLGVVEGCAAGPILFSSLETERLSFRGSSYFNCQDGLEAEQCRGGVDCATGVVRLGPGESMTATWSGDVDLSRNFDESCAPTEGCTSYCYRRVPAPAGNYRFELGEVYGTCTGDACDDCISGAGVCYAPVNVSDLAEPLTFPTQAFVVPDLFDDAGAGFAWSIE